MTKAFAVLLILVYTVSPSMGDLLLDEDFEYFNFHLWKHEITLGGGGNYEFQYYNNNRTNSFVKDGVLYIEPSLTADDIGEDAMKRSGILDVWGSDPASYCTGPNFYGCFRQAGGGGNYLNPVKSARIRTAESFTFRYGKVEVRAKLPRGDWLWPAIWMLPRHAMYGNWPASGEIDIMEARGNGPFYPGGGYDSYSSALHWGPGPTESMYPLSFNTTKPGLDLSAEFHTYGLLWNESYIGTYLDDESNVVLSFPMGEDFSFWELGGWDDNYWNNPWVGGGRNAPFDQEFYLIINLAVGGVSGFFPDGDGKPWTNESPHAVNEFWDAKEKWYYTWESPFAIDSVRVWSKVTEKYDPG